MRTLGSSHIVVLMLQLSGKLCADLQERTVLIFVIQKFCSHCCSSQICSTVLLYQNEQQAIKIIYRKLLKYEMPQKGRKHTWNWSVAIQSNISTRILNQFGMYVLGNNYPENNLLW